MLKTETGLSSKAPDSIIFLVICYNLTFILFHYFQKLATAGVCVFAVTDLSPTVMLLYSA